MIVNTSTVPAQMLYGLAYRFQSRIDYLNSVNVEIANANVGRPVEEQVSLHPVPSWQEFLDSEFVARANEANQVLQAEANSQLATFVNSMPEETINALKQQFNVPNLIRDDILAEFV
jgi:predicted Zn-dependent protease